MFMADKYEKRHYMKDYDGFDGGWSMCDTQYETFCIWVGELNPAFVSFRQICAFQQSRFKNVVLFLINNK